MSADDLDPVRQQVPQWRNDAGLAGNSVVITGAAGGIGRCVASAFAEAGATVLTVDRPGSGVGDLIGELAGSGHRAVEADLRDLGTHEDLMNRASHLAPRTGRLAALIHLAAVMRRRRTVDDVSEEDWDIQADVNLKSTFFLNRAAWRCMRSHSAGAIVNFTSQGWWTGGYGGSVAYSATKGGIVSLTRGLARSFATDGVRVNAVAPGGVDTDMFHIGLDDHDEAAFVGQVPLGRLAAPEEMAGATLFLASEASRYMTGTVLNVSGGQLIY